MHQGLGTVKRCFLSATGRIHYHPGMVRNRFAALAFLCLALWSGGVRPTAAATVDRAQIERHLDAVFGADDRIVRKWPDDIRYSVLGTPTPQHRDGVRRAMDAIAAATGLPVTDVTDTDAAANIVLFFTDTLDELLPDPWFARLFQQPEESLHDFAAGMQRRFGRTGWMLAHDYDGDDEDVAMALVNSEIDNGDPALLAMRMALGGFFSFNPSDEIRPSLMNTGPLADPQLGEIDRALLSALYSDRVESGQEYGELRATLIDLIVEKLRGI